MSRYTSFTKLKHLIFLNGGSRLEGRQGKKMRKRSPLPIDLLLVMATGLNIYTAPQQYEYQHTLTEASHIEKTNTFSRIRPG
jgi:hypothetical protein